MKPSFIGIGLLNYEIQRFLKYVKNSICEISL